MRSIREFDSTRRLDENSGPSQYSPDHDGFGGLPGPMRILEAALLQKEDEEGRAGNEAAVAARWFHSQPPRTDPSQVTVYRTTDSADFEMAGPEMPNILAQARGVPVNTPNGTTTGQPYENIASVQMDTNRVVPLNNYHLMGQQQQLAIVSMDPSAEPVPMLGPPPMSQFSLPQQTFLDPYGGEYHENPQGPGYSIPQSGYV